VDLCDLPDDREAEPDTAGRGSRADVEPLERLKEAWQLVRRDRRSAIGDRENGAPRRRPGCELDPAPGDVVADRVRDEVRDKAAEEHRIAGRPGRLEHDHPLEADRVLAMERLSREGGKVDRLPTSGPAPAPDERQACLDQELLLLAGAEDVRADLAPAGHIRVRITERQLEEGALGRERGAQLVGHVGGEALASVEWRGRGAHGPAELL
jgi:hypothetical protein